MFSISHIVCTDSPATVKHPYWLGNGRNTFKSQVSRCQPRANLAHRPFWRQKPQACCADSLVQSSHPILFEQSHTPRSLLVTILKYMETFFKFMYSLSTPTLLTFDWKVATLKLSESGAWVGCWHLPKDVCSWVASHCLMGHTYGRFLEGSEWQGQSVSFSNSAMWEVSGV